MNSLNTTSLTNKLWKEGKSKNIIPSFQMRKLISPIIQDESLSSEYYIIQAQENLNQALLLSNYAEESLNRISRSASLLRKVRDSYGLEDLNTFIFGTEEDPGAATGTPGANPTNPQSGAPEAGATESDQKGNETAKKMSKQRQNIFIKIWMAIKEAFKKIVTAISNFVKSVILKIKSGDLNKESAFVQQNMEKFDAIVKALNDKKVDGSFLVPKLDIVAYITALPGNVQKYQSFSEIVNKHLNTTSTYLKQLDSTNFMDKVMAGAKTIIAKIAPQVIINDNQALYAEALSFGSQPARNFIQKNINGKELNARNVINVIFYNEVAPKVQKILLGQYLTTNNIIDLTSEKVINAMNAFNESAKNVMDNLNTTIKALDDNDDIQKLESKFENDSDFKNKSKTLGTQIQAFNKLVQFLQKNDNIAAGVILGIYQEFNKQRSYVINSFKKGLNLISTKEAPTKGKVQKTK